MTKPPAPNEGPPARPERPRCGARCRSKGGAPCEAPVAVVAGEQRGRCRVHGGASTGPKTSEGRARIIEAQRRRWAAKQSGGDEPPPEAA